MVRAKKSAQVRTVTKEENRVREKREKSRDVYLYLMVQFPNYHEELALVGNNT